jgi:hypothetical protein
VSAISTNIVLQKCTCHNSWWPLLRRHNVYVISEVVTFMFSKTERQNRELLTLMFVIKKNQWISPLKEKFKCWENLVITPAHCWQVQLRSRELWYKFCLWSQQVDIAGGKDDKNVLLVHISCQ